MPVVDVDRLKKQGRRFVDGFTPGQKAMTILGIVAVVFAGMTFMKWEAKPDMAPLYTGLSSQDAGAVTAALDTQHVKYEITGGGGMIMVQRKDVDKARIALSAKNIPSGANSNGSELHVPGVDSNSNLAETQAYDATLEKNIEDMVAKSLGPGHAAVTVAADLDASKSTSTQSNNAVNSTVTHSDIPPGTVKHLSMSVLLDSAVVKPTDIASIWQPSILAASGIQPKRDGANALKVTTVAFAKTAQQAEQTQLAATSAPNSILDLLKHFLTLLIIALVLFFAWRAIKLAENNRVQARIPIDIRELDDAAQLEPAFAAARIAASPAGSSLDPLSNTIEDRITALIERQPDEVAQTLRSWLADRRT